MGVAVRRLEVGEELWAVHIVASHSFNIVLSREIPTNTKRNRQNFMPTKILEVSRKLKVVVVDCYSFLGPRYSLGTQN